ncbi:MAG: polysaccharide ABC transporter ATP-binding protein [Oscillatoria sp. PMC 1068.18]|nr:polysaccharide ABC transporter ATP-binding protein [Oscillatoria sp. PMC 1068.18]
MAAALSGWRYLRPKDTFWVLQDINFDLSSGEMLGIVGKNGAGKSTLLQLLGGIIEPTQGEIKINGRLSGLLDLGAGFHDDLTGRENVTINGVILGLTLRQVRRRLETIIQFAELERFIDNPMRTYSTGMKMRLAFSVAIHSDPEVLLLDEYLSVGDSGFQEKGLNRVLRLKEAGCAIVLISHNTEKVVQYCDRALWLHQGKICGRGKPETVVEDYLSLIAAPQEQTEAGKATLTKVQLFSNSIPVSEISTGDQLKIVTHYQLPSSLPNATLEVKLTNIANRVYFHTAFVVSQQKTQAELSLERVDLARGQYLVQVSLNEPDTSPTTKFWHKYQLKILGLEQRGIICPPHHWRGC